MQELKVTFTASEGGLSLEGNLKVEFVQEWLRLKSQVIADATEQMMTFMVNEMSSDDSLEDSWTVKFDRETGQLEIDNEDFLPLLAILVIDDE